MVADLFMCKTYKQHYQWLKLLTIYMPFTSSPYTFRRCRNRVYHNIVPKLPFRS